MEQRIEYENYITILYLFNRLKQQGGRMRTAKLLYLFEDELYQAKMVGSTYIMKRYQMGPYNTQIATDLKDLADGDLLKTEELYYEKVLDFFDIYSPNNKTTKFLKSIEDLIQEHSEIFEKLDLIVDIYSYKSGEELKDHLYSLHKTGSKQKRIVEYYDQEVILNPKKVSNPKNVFHISEDWYDTVEILLNPDLYYGLQQGIKDAREGRFTHELG